MLYTLLCHLGSWSSRSRGAWSVSDQWGCHLEPLADPYGWNHSKSSQDFGAKACHPPQITTLLTQLLTCYWALIDTEGSTMGHQATLWPELFLMSWVLSDPPSHKVRLAKQYSIIIWNWNVWVWAWVGPEGPSKLNEVAQMPKVPHSLLSLSLHQRISLQSVDRGKDLGLVYRWSWKICRHHPNVDSCSTTAPFWSISEGW